MLSHGLLVCNISSYDLSAGPGRGLGQSCYHYHSGLEADINVGTSLVICSVAIQMTLLWKQLGWLDLLRLRGLEMRERFVCPQEVWGGFCGGK
eukprot:c17935_g1_i1 orf=319-597(-)